MLGIADLTGELVPHIFMLSIIILLLLLSNYVIINLQMRFCINSLGSNPEIAAKICAFVRHVDGGKEPAPMTITDAHYLGMRLIEPRLAPRELSNKLTTLSSSLTKIEDGTVMKLNALDINERAFHLPCQPATHCVFAARSFLLDASATL